MLMGRELQKKMNDREKFVLTTPMILGTDGRQMSKTSGNCVWLQDPPDDMYGKLMSVPDEQIIPYLALCTDVALDEINQLKQQLEAGTNPKDIKQRMSREITTIWHNAEASAQAESAWTGQFSEGGLPTDVPIVKAETGSRQLADLLVETKLVESKTEAKRLIEQGAVRLNQEKVTAESVDVKSGDILQAGKRRFIRINA